VSFNKKCLDSLRNRLLMEPYTVAATDRYPLNPSDDWLRKRQGLALPVLPPTTPEARKYFFTKIREFSEAASISGRKTVNYEAFAQDWNQSADGKERFYVTMEVLMSYAKSWEKTSNIRASQELISEQMATIAQSKQIFLASNKPFPQFLTTDPVQLQPMHGVLDLHDHTTPFSLSTELAISQPPLPPITEMPQATAAILPVPTTSDILRVAQITSAASTYDEQNM